VILLRPRFEPDTSRIQILNINATLTPLFEKTARACAVRDFGINWSEFTLRHRETCDTSTFATTQRQYFSHEAAGPQVAERASGQCVWMELRAYRTCSRGLSTRGGPPDLASCLFSFVETT
jgi:hypothetical protein